ncbi:MAG TPA: hypothetical protein DDZ89_11080 [Clostridiales bacterium]|nr:hypothetical protein [Clostridiales bacterium]
MFKRLLCLVSLLVMLSMCFTLIGCSQSGEGSEEETGTGTSTKAQTTTKKPVVTTTTQVTTAEEVNPFKDFYEITWLTQLNADWREGRWDELELEERFNVDLQVWAEDGRNTERMAALVAAGDIPDYFYMPQAPMQPYKMYESGVTRSITLQQMKDWIPGYVESTARIPIGFSYNLVSGKDDEYIGFTHNNMGGCQFFYDATCINLDWLENVGYGIDESEMTPFKTTVSGYEQYDDNLWFAEGNFSFDDLNEIMKRFTEDDPDGNGVDDTFGAMYMVETQWTNMTQEGLFGFVHDLKYLYKDPVTGDIVPKYAYTPYKDYLAWVSDSITKGYMTTLAGKESWVLEYEQLTATNKVGIFSIVSDGYIYLNSTSYQVFPPQNIFLQEKFKDERFVIGPMFKGPDGKGVNMTYGIDPYGEGSYRVQLIGAQVDDGKLERICNILQYTTFSSQENYVRYNSGIEGVHFKWAGEPYKSNMIKTAVADLAEEYRGQLKVFSLFYTPSTVQQQIDNALKDGYWWFMPFMHYNGLFEKYALNPEKHLSEAYMGRELYAEYVDANATANQELNPIIADFKSRALSGQIANLNTEWSEYIDQLYANGLQKMVDDFYNNPSFVKYDPGEKFTMKD